MTKTRLRTDPSVLIEVTFKRDSQAPDSDGHYDGTETTIASAIKGELQTTSGSLDLASSRLDPKATHLFIPQERITEAIQVGDYMDEDASGKRNQIVEIRDYGGTYLQELMVERKTN